MDAGGLVKGQLIKWGMIAVIVIIILYFIKTRMDASKNNALDVQKQDEGIKSDQVRAIVKGINKNRVHFSGTALLNFAKALQGAFGSYIPPKLQDGDTIKRIFSALTTLDEVKALILAYGIRDGYILPDKIADSLSAHSLAGFSKADLNDMMQKKKIAFVW